MRLPWVSPAGWLVASSKRAVGGSGGFLKLLAGVLDHAIVKASGVTGG